MAGTTRQRETTKEKGRRLNGQGTVENGRGMGGEAIRYVDPASLVVDASFAEVVPAMSGEERATLLEDVGRYGVRVPIVVWRRPGEGSGEDELVVVDGHNRREVALELGVLLPVIEEEFAGPADARERAIRSQLSRRNLSRIARIQLAERLKPTLEQAARERQLRGTDASGRAGGRGRRREDLAPDEENPRPNLDEGSVEATPGAEESPVTQARGRTDQQIADEAGVSKGYFRQYEKLKAAGRDDLISLVDRGEVTMNGAANVHAAWERLPPAVARAVEELDAARDGDPERRHAYDLEGLEALGSTGEEDALACLRLVGGGELADDADGVPVTILDALAMLDGDEEAAEFDTREGSPEEAEASGSAAETPGADHAERVRRALEALPTAVAVAAASLDPELFSTAHSLRELGALDKMGEERALEAVGLMTGAVELPKYSRKPKDVLQAKSIADSRRRDEARREAYLRRGAEAVANLPKERLLGWHHGRWQDHVGALPKNAARALICDPPFGIDHEGGHAFVHHGPIEGDTSPYHAALGLREMFKKFDRVLLPDAHILIFCDAELESLMRGVVVSAGYRWRSSLAWSKGSPGLRSPTTAFEQDQERIIHAVKGKPLPGSQKNLTTLMHPRVVEKERAHRHQKPLTLALELIQATTAPGDLVLDPFGGVATMPFAALANGRRAWGAEYNEKFWEVGEARLQDARRGREAYLEAVARERPKSAAEKEGNEEPGAWTPTRPTLHYRTNQISTIYPSYPDPPPVGMPSTLGIPGAVAGALASLGDIGVDMAARQQAAREGKLLVGLDDDLRARLDRFALSHRLTPETVVEHLVREHLKDEPGEGGSGGAS
ncbi:MAG: DNA modification methylase [Actinomycetota bacterium]|nr:DNA modification methylase [Actinomycetota bacterium]